MTTWSKSIDNILRVGISLHDYGIHNWVLTKEQCLVAIKKFEDAKIAIVGGDVMEGSKKEEIGFSSASWHSDRQEHEEYDEYVKRSIQDAKEYILNYPISENIYFAFVF